MDLRNALSIAIPALAVVAVLTIPGKRRITRRPPRVDEPPARRYVAGVFGLLLAVKAVSLGRVRGLVQVVFPERHGAYNRWFIALMIVAAVVVLFVNWTPALIALAVVIVIGGLGQAAGLWHPRKRQ
jgi:hypothetical protein